MKARTIALILLLAVPAAAQNCGTQQWIHIDGLDPNYVSVDPYSRVQGVVLIAHAMAGQRCTVVGRACDPDGDQMYLTVQNPMEPNSIQQLPVNSDGTFSLSIVRTSPGIEYRWVSATDSPPDPNQAITVTGTYAVIFRGNSAPILSAVAQSVATQIMKQTQKDIQVARKLNGPTHFDNAVAPREGKFFLLARD